VDLYDYHLLLLMFKNIKRLIVFFRPAKRYAFFAGFFTLIAVLLDLPLPLLTRYIIDNVIPGKNTVILKWIIIGLIGFMLLKGLSEVLNRYYLTLFRERVLSDIQADLFRHVMGLDLTFFGNSRTGYLISRMSSDISNLQGLLAGTMLDILKDGLMFLVGLIIILSFHWKLALLSILVLPFFIFSIRFFSKRVKEMSREFQEKYARVFDTLYETISSIFSVKCFQLEDFQIAKFITKMRERIHSAIDFSVITSLSSYITAFIGGMGPLVVLWYGGREVMKGNLTLGTLIAFNIFLGYIFGPAQRLTNQNTQVQTSLASLERVFELFDTRSQIREPSRGKDLVIQKAEIRFDNVCFSYDGSSPVLSDINLTMRGETTVALVGKSGAGKSTLVNLLLRFYEPQQGNIYIDSINIKDVKISDLRKIIGIVPQDVFLFSGTVKENIRYGKIDASEEDILEAAKLANIQQFIERLPNGYDTEVGERGVKLSGGQRQRVAIARAFLRDPKILILDEATSEIDSESEMFIKESLLKLMRKRTTIIIAHRFSTVLIANEIIVIDAGHIIDSGKHEELYRRCQIYKELCDYQLFIPNNGHNIEKISNGVLAF